MHVKIVQLWPVVWFSRQLFEYDRFELFERDASFCEGGDHVRHIVVGKTETQTNKLTLIKKINYYKLKSS